jgi:triacylglycerol lipase
VLAAGLLTAVITAGVVIGRNAYGAGPMAGHAVLDGIRAAERLPGTGLAGLSTPVGLLGYRWWPATSWAAELNPGYAPELDIKGIASGGTLADLRGVARQMDGGPFAGLVIAAVVGITREYPQLLCLVNDAGKAMIARIGDRCVEQESAANAWLAQTASQIGACSPNSW